ncbi:MAG: HD domain-containing protein [Lachnospiraceae bacterium]|nr:HD domain-containing protein [Lachnospiraceae bacterium]
MENINGEELVKFPLEYLWEGLILEEDVFDTQGRALLIRAGEVITGDRLRRIEMFAGENHFVLTGRKSYEAIMQARHVVVVEDQKELEDSSGYTDLRMKVTRLIENAQLTGKVDSEVAAAIADETFDKMGDNSISVWMNCIDTPRPMDQALQRHSLNVGILNGMTAIAMGLPDIEVIELVLVGILHDIGKTKIPDKILNAPRKLTKEEFAVIKMHPIFSVDLLEDKVDKRLKEGVLFHHEREDGSGYPKGLSDNIPFYAKMTAVSDVFEALISARVYKDARVPFDVLDGLKNEKNQGLNAEIVTVFVQNMMTYYRGKEVRMEDGTVGEVFFVPPNDISHPVIRMGSVIRQADEYWKCKRVVS